MENILLRTGEVKTLPQSWTRSQEKEEEIREGQDKIDYHSLFFSEE